jgi:hypothetical protein
MTLLLIYYFLFLIPAIVFTLIVFKFLDMFLLFIIDIIDSIDS